MTWISGLAINSIASISLLFLINFFFSILSFKLY